MKRLLALVVLTGNALAVTTGGDAGDFARYQSIVDRAPFGAIQGAPTDAAPNWLARWQYVGNTVSNSGNGPVQAILFDKESNRSYFRAEGEAVDANVTVVKIDITQRPPKVILKNGLETATLTFPERTAVAGVPGNQPPAQNPVPGGAQPPTIRRIPFRRGN